MTELEKSLMNQIDNLYLHYSSKKVVVSEQEAKLIESLNERIKELENENEELIRKLHTQDFVYNSMTKILSDALNKSNDMVNSLVSKSNI